MRVTLVNDRVTLATLEATFVKPLPVFARNRSMRFNVIGVEARLRMVRLPAAIVLYVSMVSAVVKTKGGISFRGKSAKEQY